MITSIAFSVYPVTDVARARQFYEGVLGLKLTHSFQDEWIEYDIADGTFAISSMDADHKPGLRGGVIAFEVDDLDAELARLKGRGARFVMEVTTTPVCRFAIVADPDDNHLIIHQRNS
ncbi:MAG: VOC family protein [Verrucomicrobia bacterium]|nr:VOC family protein [Verrucomicrobiota bacterium]